VEGELAHQNIKDRYYGVNDPVAQKLLTKADVQLSSVKPPDDSEITTLWLGGVTSVITEEDIRDVFYGFGEICSIKVVPKSNCAFVTYTTREGAEKATEKLGNRPSVKGLVLKMSWGKPHVLEDLEGKKQGQEDSEGTTTTTQAGGYTYGSYNFQQSYLPVSGSDSSQTYKPYYPSMDPSQLGSRNPDHRPAAGES